MGHGTARGGHLSCKEEKQKGSIPLCSTKVKQIRTFETHVWLVNLKTIQKLAHRGTMLSRDVVS